MTNHDEPNAQTVSSDWIDDALAGCLPQEVLDHWGVTVANAIREALPSATLDAS